MCVLICFLFSCLADGWWDNLIRRAEFYKNTILIQSNNENFTAGWQIKKGKRRVKKRACSDWNIYSFGILRKLSTAFSHIYTYSLLNKSFPLERTTHSNYILYSMIIMKYSISEASQPVYWDTPWFPWYKDLEVLQFQSLQSSCRQGKRVIIEVLLYLLQSLFFRAVSNYHW